jgi:release factor glutamine methyltransferase
MVYEPSEDTYLLIECLPTNLTGMHVLEIGCGSGIVCVEAAKRGGVVTAVDIDEQAVRATTILAKEHNVSVTALQGDLFTPINNQQFDLVICNPPYLPSDEHDPDIALDGGTNGHEFIERFLQQVKEHLKMNGTLLLLYSSRTNKERVRELINEQQLTVQHTTSKHVGFFEELIVDALSKE